MSKRAVIYLRVSSASQVNTDYDPEGLSLPAQRKRCHEYAERLGATVTREYVEPGISGGSILKRAAFQRMLSDIETQRDVDAVIVWNISRWARNETDLWVAFDQLQRNGVELVSASEPIDNSPTGLLMLGVLGAVVAHERRKLSTEISRGRQQKAEVGGTPGRCAIGYKNIRTDVDGREVRDVALDPERAPLIRIAFEMYATGRYSLGELAEILEDRGLRTRKTARYPSKPVDGKTLGVILRNDYYIGIVRNAGKPYKGRHEPLVSVSVFERVQHVLDAKRRSGERDRVHPHYLKGSLYCGECGARLFFSQNRGRRGVLYDYFLCRGRQTQTCSQPHHSVEEVETEVIRHYGTISIKAERREAIRQTIRKRFKELEGLSIRELDQARRTVDRLLNQERKLLNARYDDRISDALFAEEEQRIRKERAAAEETLTRLSGEYEIALANLDKALDLTDNVQAAYEIAPPTVRRALNQVFFKKLYVIDGQIADHVLGDPFGQVLEAGLKTFIAEAKREPLPEWLQPRTEVVPAATVRREPREDRTPDLSLVGGSNTGSMVELAGLEPATSCMPCKRSPS
jgi:site-specific DNA recombinase